MVLKVRRLAGVYFRMSRVTYRTWRMKRLHQGMREVLVTTHDSRLPRHQFTPTSQETHRLDMPYIGSRIAVLYSGRLHNYMHTMIVIFNYPPVRAKESAWAAG